MQKMTKEVQKMLQELLNTTLFQESLNIASLKINISTYDLNKLKEHLPKNRKEFTVEDATQAISNYRADLITQTRAYIQALLIQKDTTKTTHTRNTADSIIYNREVPE